VLECCVCVHWTANKRCNLCWTEFGGTLPALRVQSFTTSSLAPVLPSLVLPSRPPPADYASVNALFDGSGSSVGIATDYGLDGPGIESRWGRDFPHLSRPALGPTQPPVQWVPGLCRG
jgi:hypothetical protein